jgi:hypothetical protein
VNKSVSGKIDLPADAVRRLERIRVPDVLELQKFMP